MSGHSLLEQFNLKGKTALVTGGSSGLGLHFSRILAQAGATVMIAARREDKLREAKQLLTEETGRDAYYKTVDLGIRNEATGLIEHAVKTMGSLDILVGNAGIEVAERIENFRDESYDSIVEVNLTSNVFMTRAALPIMKKQGWGRIVFITSVSAQVAFSGAPLGIYATTKAGLEGFARFAAVENASKGITVNCISPGSFKTEMVDQFLGNMSKEKSERFMEQSSRICAMNRWGEPEELAGTLLLLASDAGSFITGATYVVDGGNIPQADRFTS